MKGKAFKFGDNISTDHIGLYEKYGFVFWKIMNNREGNPTRVYIKNL